jgi:hypothetical protein
MQLTLIQNNKIENIIVCEPNILPNLGLDYDEYIEYERFHEIGVEYINGEFYNYINDIRMKYNVEYNEWELEDSE